MCPQCEHRLQPPAFPPAPLRPSTAHRAMSPKQAPHRMPVAGKGRRARQRPGKNLALRPALESSVALNPRCLTYVSISGHLNLHVSPAMCSAAPAGPCGGQPAPKHGRSSASTLSLSPRSRAPQLSHRLALTAAPARPLIRPLQGKNRTAALERLTAGASPPASLGAAEFDSPVNGAHWSTFWPRGKVCGSRQASKLAPPPPPPPPRPHSPGPLPPTLGATNVATPPAQVAAVLAVVLRAAAELATARGGPHCGRGPPRGARGRLCGARARLILPILACMCAGVHTSSGRPGGAFAWVGLGPVVVPARVGTCRAARVAPQWPCTALRWPICVFSRFWCE